jgi:toxin ParE1/3/4
MSYIVYFVDDAEKDLFEIYEYIKKSGYPFNAMGLYSQIERACFDLSEMPERGHIPPELERIGVLDYREIHVKVYRIIYQVFGSDVYIHCILDGRRDIQAILQQRILR